MRKTSLAALLSLAVLAAPAMASTTVLGYQAAATGLLENVMVAMNDAPGTGETIVQWLRGNGAVVKFQDGIPGAAVHLTLVDMGSGKTTPGIYIDSKYSKEPVSYRYLATLIAREASEMMLADFPVSAERTYMISARTAEAFFELGGERVPLPRIDGVTDTQAAESIQLWVENAPDQGVKLLKSQGYDTLGDIDGALTKRIETFKEEMRGLISKLPDAEGPEVERIHRQMALLDHKTQVAEATQALVKKAEAQFLSFKSYEKDWLLSHTVK